MMYVGTSASITGRAGLHSSRVVVRSRRRASGVRPAGSSASRLSPTCPSRLGTSGPTASSPVRQAPE
eukprot:4169336-Pyramimonas_sp.AAC.1